MVIFGAATFGGARLPNGRIILAEGLMFKLPTALLHLKMRRAVVQRITSARRICWRNTMLGPVNELIP
jgi:hypothetical protein